MITLFILGSVFLLMAIIVLVISGIALLVKIFFPVMIVVAIIALIVKLFKGL